MNISYDVLAFMKRSSIILSLLVLIAVGVASLGLTYFMDLSNLQPYHYAFITYNDKLGYILNFYGKPIANAKILMTRGITISNSSGLFRLNGIVQSVEINNVNVTFISNKYFIVLNTTTNEAELVVLAPPGTKVYYGYSPTSLTYLGVVKHAINEFIVNYSPSFISIYVKLNSTTFSFNIPYKVITPVEFVMRSSQLLLPLYSLILIYLVFSLFVSQKSNKSLDLVLATPITRRGLFFSRLLVGLIVIIGSSFITALITSLATMIVTSYEGSFLSIISPPLYLLLSYELSFYSLYLLIGIMMKNNAHYLFASVTIFIALFILTTEQAELPTFISYLDPMIIEFNSLKYLTVTLWIIIPLIISLIYFNVTDDV
ncbi:MAG: ABC transporter permease subunit [Sulfolobaceae archaeon]|nr:ABC transporter permease subunit [Sulfolobaceae archaeon]